MEASVFIGFAPDFTRNRAATSGPTATTAASQSLPRFWAIRAYEAASRGAALTQHLLAFARKQPLRPTSVDNNALIVDTVQLLKPAIGELVTIDFQPGEQIYPLLDPNQLATAILNLALNARDAMPDGGQLRIETSNIELRIMRSEHSMAPPPANM
jgi:signal transduction histidine kinase